MDKTGINLQRVDAIYTSKAERALSFLPALIMHVKRAAQTALLEKLDVKTCPAGANGAINTLWRGMLQVLIGRQNDPSVRPSQGTAAARRSACRATGAWTQVSQFGVKLAS